MNSLFNFSNHDSGNSNVPDNVGNTQRVLQININEEDIIKNYVDRLNKKVNDPRLIFRYYLENERSIVSPNTSASRSEVIEYTFYLTLTIYENKVLNILRGKIDTKRSLPLTDIIWQYNLSEEFMNYIYDECKKLNNSKELFYEIILIYYEVVERQLNDFVLNYNNSTTNKINQYIFFYNVYLKKKIFKDLSLLNNFKNNNFINFYNTNYYEIFLLLIDDDIFNNNYNLNIKMDLYFFIIFFNFDNYFFFKKYMLFNINENLTIEILKNYMLKNLYNFKLTNNIKDNSKQSQTERDLIGLNHHIILNQTNSITHLKRMGNQDNSVLDKFNNIIEDKNFLFLIKITSVKEALGGYIFEITNNIFKIMLRPTEVTSEKFIDNNLKTIKFSEENNQLIFDGIILFNNKLPESIINIKKMCDYGLFIDYKNNFANVNLNIKLKIYIIKIIAECVARKINSEFIIKLIDYLLKPDISKNCIKTILEFLTNIQNIQNILLKSSLKEERIQQGYNILFDTISGKVTVNRTKKIETTYDNSILIISFNEEHSAYDIVDCIPILYKVLTERPLFIVLGSQESTSQLIPAVIGKAVHYPHVLGECLKQIGYGINDDLKASAHKLKIFDKNVRLRTFFDTESISYKNNAPSKNIKIVNFKKSVVKGDYVTSYKNKKYIFFENSLSGSFFKGTIFFKIDINFKGKVRKFIFVNSHFFYTEKGNTGSITRQKLLHKLITMPIKEFDNKSLIQLYSDKSYNVFFFGDLNFRLLINDTQNKLEQIKQIKQKYLKYLKNNIKNKSQKNELELYLNKSIQKFSEYNGTNITNMEQKMVEAGFLDENEKRFVFEGSNVEKEMKEIIQFYQKFKQSFDALGYDLLYKYKIKSDDSLNIYNARKQFYDLVKNNSNKMNIKLFNEKNGKRVPSTTDRILFALNDNIEITRDDLDLYLYPDKSDHLMITLKVSLDNISEVKNVLLVQQPKLETVLVYQPSSSNSSFSMIPFGEKNNNTNNDPRFLVFNFDEKCEELLTDRFYVSKDKTIIKQAQQKIINDFIQQIKNQKPAIVVVCTRNSPSRTDKHYQHSLKNEILQLNKDSGLGVNYFPLLKSDSTLQSNVTSLKSIGKKLCGIRSRLYVDQNQLLFKYNEKEISKSYSGKGNETRNEYEHSNNIQKSNERLKQSTRISGINHIGSIIKYGRSRVTGNDKKSGVITLNVVIELNDKTKKQYLFCNYLSDFILKNNGPNKKKNIENIGYVYLFTNKN
jgi:hypothetical protein